MLSLSKPGLIVVLLAMLMLATPVVGQIAGVRPMRIVTGEVGGGTDLTSRIIGQELTAQTGQAVVVENRGGSGAAVAALTVIKASPDGRTLLLYGSTIWLAPFLRSNVPYDPVADLAPVILAVSVPHMIVVNPAVPASSAKELLALAKARPGQLNVASPSTGSPTHLAFELFRVMAGVDIVRVPYKGTTPALNDTIGGQVQLMFVVITAGMPQVKAGKLKALAITSAQPSALAPGLPTVSASGLPGFESASVFGAFAPAKTPVAAINRVNQDIVRVLQREEIKEKFFNAGAEVVGSSPQQFGAMVKADMSRMGKIIKDAGIREE